MSQVQARSEPLISRQISSFGTSDSGRFNTDTVSKRAVQIKALVEDIQMHTLTSRDADKDEGDFDKENIWIIVIGCVFLLVVMVGVLYRLQVLKSRRLRETHM